MKLNNKKWKKIEVAFELLVFGIVLGITEDLIAIKYAAKAPITPRVVVFVVAIAIPFAVIGEVIFDRVDFASIFKRIFEKKK